MSSRRDVSGRGLFAVIAVYAVVDLMLIFGVWFINDVWQPVLTGVPLSQCSLAVIWSVFAARDPWKRCIVPILGTLLAWFVMTTVHSWGMREQATVGWLLAITVQAVAIVAASKLGTYVQRVRTKQTKRRSKAVRFSISSVILLTTTFALACGFLRFGSSAWQWDAYDLRWTYVPLMPVIGLFNALVAMACLVPHNFAGWKSKVAATAAAVIVVSLVALVIPLVAENLVALPAIEPYDTLIVGLSQFAQISLVLAAWWPGDASK